MAALVPPDDRATLHLVTWAPTSARRRRDRGYDQAQLLAVAVARALGVPSRATLVRARSADPQTGSSRSERLSRVGFAARRPIAGRLVLVDDVVTTGATLRAAAQALRRAGAESVIAIAAAATPSDLTWHAGYGERSPSE
jgi:predicted amidophosphoribosyltransferase